jgi:flagellar assembly protein FliH
MSDAAIVPVSLVVRRSAFKPICALGTMRADTSPPVDDYARGLADGQELAQTAFATERAALQQLLASSEAFEADTGPELSLLLRETVVRLVGRICDHVAIDVGFLENQIAQAVGIITEADDARQILLHPEDAALVGDCIHSLPVRGNPALARGTIRIECSQGWVENGVALGIERLREVLEVTA